jgi:PAS domain S-box-containing protein
METVVSTGRGYTVTGEERYLDPYRAVGLSLAEHAAVVRNLTADNAAQQLRIAALEKLAADRLERIDEIIRLRRDRGFEAAAEAMRTGPGLRATAEYRAIVVQMEGEEQRLVMLRSAEMERNRSWTKIILILGSVLGLLIIVAAGWSFQRENSRREVAEEALRESERRYRMLVDGVKDYAILMLGPQGEIRSWNPGAERMSGCTFGEVEGQNYSRFFPESAIKLGRPQEMLRLAAASGEYEEQGMRCQRQLESDPGLSITISVRFMGVSFPV